MGFCRSWPKGNTDATTPLSSSDKATHVDIKNYKSNQKCWRDPEIRENENVGEAQN